MATLHVRNVPDALYEALRARAESQGRSIGSEAIAILAETVTQGTFRRLGRRVRRGTLNPPVKPSEQLRGRTGLVITAAQHEARDLKHNYIGTEHVLLGLLREGGAADALGTLGITSEAVRARVVDIIGPGETEPSGSIPFTPRTKKVLELALREALSLGNPVIEDEHILIALACEGEGVAARILQELGADEARIREALFDLPPPPPGPGWEYRAVVLSGSADEWTETLNALAAEGWQLLSMVTEDGEQRAVLRRRPQ